MLPCSPTYQSRATTACDSKFSFLKTNHFELVFGTAHLARFAELIYCFYIPKYLCPHYKMARLAQAPMTPRRTISNPDSLTDLNRLLARLQQNIIHADAERERRLRASEYERSKAKAVCTTFTLSSSPRRPKLVTYELTPVPLALEHRLRPVTPDKARARCADRQGALAPTRDASRPEPEARSP